VDENSMSYLITTDKSTLDIDAIHDYLCNKSYWAKGRSMERVRKSIDNSICFGLYDSAGKMLGFARVVTDKVVFAYLMDVFIVEEHQRKGLGTMLVKHIVEHPDFQVRLWFLGTKDAHGLYKKFGFCELSDPQRFMYKRDENYL
jgi:GNAT superfamily N-acetyltransferase